MATLVETVAANVRAEAGRRDVSQLQIARHLGVSHSAISERWRGRRAWQLGDLDQVADLLGVTPDQLCRRATGAYLSVWRRIPDSIRRVLGAAA